jgi:hypothetical protein
MQVLENTQATRTFADRVTILVQSLNNQATPVRHAALGNLSRQIAACPQEASAMTSAHQQAIPPCRCALSYNLRHLSVHYSDESAQYPIPGPFVA